MGKQYFVEIVGIVAGNPMARIAWETGSVTPPTLCCTVEIPIRLGETLKWREVEFRVWMKDTRGRVSDHSARRLSIHD